MRAAFLSGMVVGLVALGWGAAVACDEGTGNTFALTNPDGSTSLMGSLETLKRWKRAVGGDRRNVLYARIGDAEYVVTDPTVLAQARAIFERRHGLGEKQTALQKEMDVLESRVEAEDAEAERLEEELDRRQEALDDEQDRLSDAAEHDLDALVREAIRSGKAAKPAKP